MDYSISILLKNYFGFGGRAHRKEYWMFVLVEHHCHVRAGHSGQILGLKREEEKAY